MTTAPAPTTSAARVQGATSSSTSAPGIASSAGGAAPSASSGSTASSGTAATSWNSRTAKLARPPSVWASFFSASVCITIAVDDSDRMMPTATAWFHGAPSSRATPARSASVSPTCSPPRPTSRCRRSHSILGCISSPTRNSIRTTPYSAYSCTWAVSRPTSPSAGPIAIPAAR